MFSTPSGLSPHLDINGLALDISFDTPNYLLSDDPPSFFDGS
jgi:hypothetical protein